MEFAPNLEKKSPAKQSHSAKSSPAVQESPAATTRLQRDAGNQAVQQLFRAGFIRAKLTIGNPDDPEEREADNVADTIMRKHDGSPASSPCACSHDGEMCEECRQNQSQPTVQRKASQSVAPAHAPQIVSDILHSPGHPLDASTRSFFEPRFGRDFSGVRVHSDGPAADSARAVNALAYTAGNHLVFDRGQYAPHSAGGAYLLAHELTHAVQQAGTNPRPSLMDASGPLALNTYGEANAQQVVKNIAAGRPLGAIDSAHAWSVQRQEPMPIPESGFGDLGKFGEWGKFGEMGKSSPGDYARPVAPPPEAPTSPDTTPGNTPGTTPGNTPGTTPSPWANPYPVPPVVPFPQPQPQPDEDDKRRDPQCGTKDLPLTMVTFFPGPLGQGGRVKASPLTKCPGNTRGSQPSGSIYRQEFDCINAAGEGGSWVRAHLLHGETSSSGPFNLHGPGNDIRNLIITDKSINSLMSSRAERPVIASVYGSNSVLWYESQVDSYEPGKETFGQSVTVRAGLYDTNTNSELPGLPFSFDGGPFRLKRTPPNCPPSAAIPTGTSAGAVQGVTPPVPQGSTATTPTSDLAFQGSFKICVKELEKPTPFEVRNGGLEVRVFADLFDSAGEKKLDSSACPIDHYFVVLEQSGWLWGFNRYSQTPIRVPVGQQNQPLKWTGLKSDKYRLQIFVDQRLDSPASTGAGAGSKAPSEPCCLLGDVTVSTFYAPATTGIEPMA